MHPSTQSMLLDTHFPKWYEVRRRARRGGEPIRRRPALRGSLTQCETLMAARDKLGDRQQSKAVRRRQFPTRISVAVDRVERVHNASPTPPLRTYFKYLPAASQ